MLIQSHEGFIDILPTLPIAWGTGAFRGLVARGNFEISAEWENKEFGSVEILSKVGGACTIKVPNPDNIQIIGSSNQVIPYSKVSENIIRFKTEKAGIYTIDLSK